MLFASIVLYLIAPFIIIFLFGKEYYNSILILKIAIPGVVMMRREAGSTAEATSDRGKRHSCTGVVYVVFYDSVSARIPMSNMVIIAEKVSCLVQCFLGA